MMSQEDLLKGIVYSEFDNHVGPVIRFIHPDMVLSKEYIEVISDYIVLEKHLCNEIIRISVGNLNFLLMCMNIDNPKYERNSFTFSFGLVMSEKSLEQEVDLQVYHRFLRNLTTFFYDLELESEFLSQSVTKLKLFEILKLVFENFQLNHSCFLTIEGGRIGLSKSKEPSSNKGNHHNSNFYLPLQLFTFPELSQQINDYDVPLFRCDKIQLSQLTYDISFRHIALYIDGISHVKKIAKDVNMDLHFVKKAISLLLFYNLIIVGDVFRFSNVYVYQPVRLLYPTLLKEVRDFACLESSTGSSPGNSISMLPKLSLRSFLMALQPRVDVGQALISCLRNSGQVEDSVEEDDYSLENVNLQRLIGICLNKRILKRLYEYPVFVKTGPSLSENASDFFEEKALMPVLNEENSDALPSRTPRKTVFAQSISSATESRTFNKITSKAKSVVGQSYLRDSTVPDLNDLIQSLDGSEHLDSICCRFEVPFRTIVNAVGVKIIYK